MKIKLANIVDETYTNASGYAFYISLKDALKKNETIEVSFFGMPAPSSSFLNSSFGALIEEMGLQNFMNKIKPKELTPTQAQMLKLYVQGFRASESRY